jgi:hypothetical protein
MKKALVALLILAIAGGAFAQELNLTGLINSGLVTGFGEGVSPAEDGLKAIANDAGVDLYRFQINGVYTNGDVGARFRLRAQGGNNIFLHYAYGFANLFDNLLLVNAGYIFDGTYVTQGDIGDDVGEGIGVQLQVKPPQVEGLNVGFGVYYTGKTSGTAGYLAPVTGDYTDANNNGKWDTNETITGGADYEWIDPTDANNAVDHPNFVLSAAYTMPDLFGVQARYKLVPGDKDKALLGISILALPQLTAELEFIFDNMYVNFGNKDNAAITFAQALAYEVTDQITVGGEFYEYLTRGDKTSLGYTDAPIIPLVFHPWVSYALNDQFTPKFAFGYYKNYVPDYWLRGAYSSYGVADIATGDFSFRDQKKTVMEFNPSVLWTVGTGASIDIGYSFFIKSGDGFKVAGENDKSIQKFYVDFLWSF